jgi:S-formylglutathione hydrolase FrmB
VARWLTQVSVIDGPFYLGLTVVAIACLALLVAWDRGTLRWWVVPAAAGIAVAVVGASAFILDVVWRPWPERLPTPVLAWSVLALLGAALAVLRVVRGSPWRRRAAFATAGLLTLVWGLAAVNREYGYLPTVGTVLGVAPANVAPLPERPPPQSDTDRPRPGLPLELTWNAPPDLPVAGRVVRDTPIPGTVSKFPARPGWVYLPPAYLVPNPPALPVLVLIAGQPGTPKNWFDGGRLAQTMDAFAALHHGLAPIVVVPDPLGDLLANPLCLDSALGQAETYLTRDVPDWIRRTFAVDPDPAAWAIGGFSFGGTCALQLALRAPDVYRVFVNISGQEEPSLGDRSRTVNAAFGGDESAFLRVNPRDEMARQRFPDTAGIFVVGADDSAVKKILTGLDEAAVACGISTQWLEIPGAHSWQVAAEGLRQAMPWVARRMWIITR